MFENIFEGIKEKFRESAEKKKLEKEDLERMQREVDFQRRQIFQEEFKKNALEVAKAKAKKEAAELSGLQKYRAMNRLRKLNEQGSSPDNFFTKFAEYTQKNVARREENLKRTKEMKESIPQKQIAPRRQPFGSNRNIYGKT